MPDLSNNNSFIPKRGPVNKKKQGAASRPVYVFTIISYILMFSTLIATGGVYFYGKVVDKQLSNEVTALNTAISSFSESDMQRVLEFDLRLSQAENRLSHSVSVASVFDALESATIDTVQVASLDLKREKDEQFILAATIETDSFDSTIFQRGVYQRNQTISNVAITSLQNGNTSNLIDKKDNTFDNSIPEITFIAELNVPLTAVPYVANQAPILTSPIIITEPALDTATATEETADAETVNNENI